MTRSAGVSPAGREASRVKIVLFVAFFAFGTSMCLLTMLLLATAAFADAAEKSLSVRTFTFKYKDADKAVQEVLDFLRLWANFHFPQLLRTLDRIQKDVFRRLRMPSSGNYDFYANRVENFFADPALVALEEYGIPLEVAKKLV